MLQSDNYTELAHRAQCPKENFNETIIVIGEHSRESVEVRVHVCVKGWKCQNNVTVKIIQAFYTLNWTIPLDHVGKTMLKGATLGIEMTVKSLTLIARIVLIKKS